jgi:Ni/Fe-hydrogenase subunit HybB-like protein
MGEIYYIPTFSEVTIILGIFALVILLYTVLTNVLPVEEKVPEPESAYSLSRPGQGLMETQPKKF